mmetsp:Transcript_58414/g.162850  ORF Transcript_58414/g.162850 Transcript_58414/m.162850 type:complete len:236 (+) Transcript_58414:960-1667(+)
MVSWTLLTLASTAAKRPTCSACTPSATSTRAVTSPRSSVALVSCVPSCVEVCSACARVSAMLSRTSVSRRAAAVSAAWREASTCLRKSSRPAETFLTSRASSSSRLSMLPPSFSFSSFIFFRSSSAIQRSPRFTASSTIWWRCSVSCEAWSTASAISTRRELRALASSCIVRCVFSRRPSKASWQPSTFLVCVVTRSSMASPLESDSFACRVHRSIFASSCWQARKSRASHSRRS